MTCPNLKAVIFDIGGVVLKSPFLAIAAYEKEYNIPDNYINVSITRHGDSGAWQKFERGEMPLFDFYKSFGAELSDTNNGNVWYTEYCRKKGCPPLPDKLGIDGRELFGRMMRESAEYDEHVVEAIRRIRATSRWRVIALTNNFTKFDTPQVSVSSEPSGMPLSASSSVALSATELAFLGWDQGGPVPAGLRALFDDFCDSSTLGMRKPDPAFYLLACQRSGIAPKDAVFLDDIGVNLKAARELGMKTIRVTIGGSLSALKELEVILGIDLTDGPASVSKL